MKTAQRIVAMLLLCVLAQTTQAYVIEIAFEGVVDEALGIPDEWLPDVAVGTRFTGTYKYDSDAEALEIQEGIAEYYNYGSPYGITVYIGNLVYQTDPVNGRFSVIVEDNQGTPSEDRYAIGSNPNLLPNAEAGADYIIVWRLSDVGGNAIDDISLPLIAPVLNEWTAYNSFEINGPICTPSASYRILGHVTDVTLIPEPAMLSLLAFGATWAWKSNKTG